MSFYAVWQRRVPTVTRLACKSRGDTKLKYESEFPVHLTVALVSDSVIERCHPVGNMFYGPIIYYLYYITWFPRGLCVPVKILQHFKSEKIHCCRRFYCAGEEMFLNISHLRFQEVFLFNNAFNMIRPKSTLRGEILSLANSSFVKISTVKQFMKV